MRLVTMLLVAVMALSACNTVQGVGRDVRGAGKVLESGATKVKRAVTN